MPEPHDSEPTVSFRILLLLLLAVSLGGGGYYLLNTLGNSVPLLIRDRILGEPARVDGTGYAVIERCGPMGDVWYAVGRLDRNGEVGVRPVEANQVRWEEAIPMVGRMNPGPSVAWAVCGNGQWFLWIHPVDVDHGPIQGLAHPMPDRAACVRELARFKTGARIAAAPVIRVEGDDRSVVELVAGTKNALSDR